MEITAGSLTDKDLGWTLVLGRNSKKKRHKIEDIEHITGGVRVLASQTYGGPRWILLAENEEISLEP